MTVKRVEYKGMTIKAGAFEVIGTGRFIASLSISRQGGSVPKRRSKFFEPPSPDGLYDDSDEALEAAIAFAQAIIDGEIPGLTLDGL